MSKDSQYCVDAERCPSRSLQTAGLDFAILGGGILGTAVAALAAQRGFGVVVFRQHDRSIPRADTLRNQGWRQSGAVYNFKDFLDEREFLVAARAAYTAGERLLSRCGLPLSKGRAIVKASKKHRLEEMERKLKLLRYSIDEFRQLAPDEAKRRVQEMFEQDCTYYQVPDAPFDEAQILDVLRGQALRYGAQFVQLDQPAKLIRNGNKIEIHWDGNVLVSPLTLVAAGAGSIPLLTDIQCVPYAFLRQTPLLVQSGHCGMTVPLLVDLDWGFSAVLHPHSDDKHSVVIGTSLRQEPVSFVPPDHRIITPEYIRDFQTRLSPIFVSKISGGRFTAGCEVMPLRPKIATSFLEPFIQDFGDRLVFASPGRATMTLPAAEHALAAMDIKRGAQGKLSFQYSGDVCESWTSQIHMHYMPHYNFDNAGT